MLLDKAQLPVQAYPNPFRSSELEISIETPEAAVADLRLADLAGRVLLTRTVRLPAGSTTVALPECTCLLPSSAARCSSKSW